MQQLTTAQGLHITTVNGLDVTVTGAVTFSEEHNVYYCNGQSWPSEIVKEVITCNPEHSSEECQKQNELESLVLTATRYRELTQQIKAFEEQADELKQIMIKAMDTRQTEKLKVGLFGIRYTLVESSRLDTTRLKQDHANLYDAYLKRVTSTRFQVA